MISTVTGEITYVFDRQVIVNLSGLGLLLNLTDETCAKCRPGMRMIFHTFLVVREDLLALYGFETIEERDLFIHLISVAGVGPKIALAALSTLTPESLRRAVASDQPEMFTRVPGIGKKTAQKIILELRGKIQPLEPLEGAIYMDEIDTEVMEALIALGYSVVEAQAALQYLGKNEETSAEERLRKALQYFS